jgi:hypothetical protein
MASTDFDGTRLMIVGEGSQVALVIGEKTYRGTLQLRTDGIKEEWFIKREGVEPGEPDEIQIHKIAKPSPEAAEPAQQVPYADECK